MTNSIPQQYLHFLYLIIGVIVAAALVALLVKLVQLLVQEVRRDRFFKGLFFSLERQETSL